VHNLGGSKLERMLQRYSIEGVLRLQHGLATGTLGHVGTLKFTVAEEGPWKGVWIKITADKRTKEVRAVLIPQVGARRSPTEEWEWYTPKEITSAFAVKYPKGSTSEIQVVGASQKEQKGIITILKKVGVDFNPKGQRTPPFGPDGKVGTKLEGLFTDQISRCIAKLAFNYLAYVKGPPFVLRSDFDGVRAYVLTGKKPSVRIVRPFRGQFLLEERYGGKATHGHILRVDWSADSQSVVAQLALFNRIKYTVVLCNRFNGLWTPDFAQGHHFNIETRRIEPLGVTKLHIPI
jgi:hypothetical protein